MTTQLDLDRGSKNGTLPFDPSELDRFSIRVRPSELAKLLGCTKQAVSIWIREGKISLGADGRVDPRKAVAQLLRNTDPGRLRARILQPLVRDIGVHLRRVDELEKSLAKVKEESDWNAQVNIELLDNINRIHGQIIKEWHRLRQLPADLALDAFSAWLDRVEQFGAGIEESIVDFLQTDEKSAPGN